jgi:predicted TIM-barrel fold metal-dependent hydrolase
VNHTSELETKQRIPLLDRTLDVDGHEFAPPRVWGSLFGPTAERMAEVCAPFIAMMGDNYILRPDQAADDTPMTYENVWSLRHTGAPGAFDMKRRLEAMDLMGVRRQLIFPSFGLWGQILSTGTDGGGATAQNLKAMLGGRLPAQEAKALGFAGIDEHNAWAIRSTALDPARLRVVGMIKAPRDVDDLMAQATGLIDRGVRGLLINTGTPPAGVSPAAPELDPFWALLAERNVPVLAHVGGDLGFLGASGWSNAPAFAAQKLALEVGLDPYSYATLHLAIEHFLTVVVMGGVFERHPMLRFGAIELGAHWLGPLADSLDMWATKIFARRMKPFISKKPSEYLARNVRVTPHNIVEPIYEFMTRYPHLSDCYCYSTDYPHLEGGMHIKTKVYEILKPLGDEVLEKYFATNGAWLLPE